MIDNRIGKNFFFKDRDRERKMKKPDRVQPWPGRIIEKIFFKTFFSSSENQISMTGSNVLLAGSITRTVIFLSMINSCSISVHLQWAPHPFQGTWADDIYWPGSGTRSREEISACSYREPYLSFRSQRREPRPI